MKDTGFIAFILLVITVDVYSQNACISSGGMCFSRFCPAGRSRSYRMNCIVGVCCFRRSTAFVPCLIFGGQCRSSCGSGSFQLQAPAGCEEGTCCSFSGSAAAAATDPPTARPTTRPWWNNFITTPTNIRPGNVCGYQALTQTLYGPESKPCAWPWLAAIRVGPPLPHLQRYKCAGVLVDDDTVITVAHCFDNVNEQLERIEIVIGESDLSSSDDYSTEVEVTRVIKHPNYDKNLREADLAVLKLARRIDITSCTVPVCLATNNADFPKSSLCTIAGWGSTTGVNETNKLRSARVSLMDEHECQTVLQYTRYTKPRNTLCVDVFRSQSQPCWGDEGGMLACLNNAGEYQLRGLIQRQSCEHPDSPNILLNVAEYHSWIKSQF